MASDQKSSGRFASSGGEVRRISESLTRRSRPRSALPRLGLLRLRDAVLICLPLLSAAKPSGNDPPNEFVVLSDSIGKNNREMQPVGETHGYEAAFAIVTSPVFADQYRPVEDERRKREVEAALAKVGRALGAIPRVSHL